MKRAIILLALSASAVAVNAQPAAERLTLDKAVDLALENNHLLKSAQHDVSASTWRLRNAYTSFFPKVEVSAAYARLDDETVRRANAPVDFIKQFPGLPPDILSSIRPFAYNDTYEAGLTVIQPIYNGGMEFVSVQAAEADKERSSYSYEDLRQDIIATTKITYYELLKAQELLRLAQESRDRTMRYVEKTKRQLEVGLRTNQDVLRWEVQLASDESNVINEVRHQFKTNPGIMEGRSKPDYGRCVDIVTAGALKEMVLPGLLPVLIPVAVGFSFKYFTASEGRIGAEAVAALLMVGTITGILLATMMNNGGGAWDNAKKYIETGMYGGKGSEAHKAGVVSDTVGDPLKDTAGPSLHVLIKLLSTITLVLAPLFL